MRNLDSISFGDNTAPVVLTNRALIHALAGHVNGAEMSIIYAGCVGVIILALLGILAIREAIIDELRIRDH